MATDPAFAATPNNGAALLNAQDSNLLTPTGAVAILTAGANGTKIDEIDVVGAGTTIAGLVYLWLYDGSTYHIFDEVAVSAITASTTVAPFRQRNVYSNLYLKSGWSLRASQSTAGNINILKVHGFGGDL